MVGMVATVPHRLQAFDKDSLRKSDSNAELRQIPDRMHHPLRDARPLKVGEAEHRGHILRIDHVADAERQRLSPHDDLVAGLARCLAIQRADWVDRDQ